MQRSFIVPLLSILFLGVQKTYINLKDLFNYARRYWQLKTFTATIGEIR